METGEWQIQGTCANKCSTKNGTKTLSRSTVRRIGRVGAQQSFPASGSLKQKTSGVKNTCSCRKLTFPKLWLAFVSQSISNVFDGLKYRNKMT